MRPETEKVIVAYIHPTMVHAGFHDSLMDLLEYDRKTNNRILGRLSYQSSNLIAQSRNKVVEQFLAYGQADWLLMIDTDMTFGPDALDRMLEFADPTHAPLVGGLCFGFAEGGEVRPTLYEAIEQDGEIVFLQRHEWAPDSMMQVTGTGAAFLLVHKSVFEKVRDAQYNAVFPWFQETVLVDRAIGEDLTFCIRAGQLQIPVYVNTAVQIGHIKERILTMDGYFASRGLLSFSHKGVAP